MYSGGDGEERGLRGGDEMTCTAEVMERGEGLRDGEEVICTAEVIEREEMLRGGDEMICTAELGGEKRGAERRRGDDMYSGVGRRGERGREAARN